MNWLSTRSIQFLLAVAALTFTAAAQATDFPFAAGETLTYEGKLSKIVSGIPVADLTFIVNSTENGNFNITAEARSKGTLLKIARFSFLQRYESTVNGEHFRISRTIKHDVQKDRVRNGEAFFDYEGRRVTYVETDPKDPMRPPRNIASEIASPTQDIVSGIYSLRLLPLAVGKTFELQVSDSGLVYKIPVAVTARELLKTDIGTVWCLKVEPEVFGPGRLIESEGSMTIWITDDRRRIPVRGVVKASIGKIDIRLRSISRQAENSEQAAK
ncbi:MAG: hypothetical protein C4325_08440 [Blastocatellia bacterium]